MQYIGCYDDNKDEVENICENLNITECEFIQAVLDAISAGEVTIEHHL